MEYRDTSDEAWYSVIILHEANTLHVKYDCVPISPDKVYYVSVESKKLKNWEKLSTFDELTELDGRFRPLSIQLQDNECRKVSPGLVVYAAFSNTDHTELKYYDAIVDDEEEEEEELVCIERFSIARIEVNGVVIAAAMMSESSYLLGFGFWSLAGSSDGRMKILGTLLISASSSPLTPAFVLSKDCISFARS
ncbi:hypothetical protein ACFE04_027546 [Oxalis oulophora]